MFNHKFINTIDAVSQIQWDALNDNLFCSYAWLRALEHSGCVCTETGWQPQHLLVFDNEHLIAIMPGYIKSHSYGEYVFDWSWADAYQRYGLDYYPKWLSGVPFTPIQGPRILCRQPSNLLYQYISMVLKQACEQRQWSSVHINFLLEHTALSDAFFVRHGVQFHWFNRQYQSFADFLDTLTSRKRKSIKKERQQVEQHALHIEWLTGKEISSDILQRFHYCYQLTYLKRSGHKGYLNLAFFEQLIKTMPEQIRLCIAKENQTLVAASLYLYDQHTLYGRYWGALEAYDALHFELCYYQGIEYAIKHHLQCFDAGAQGEHKITRGFEPVQTYSLHHIQDRLFSKAIKDFIAQEQTHIADYQQQCTSLLPFKKQ